MEKKLEVIAEIRSGLAELEATQNTDLEDISLKFIQDRVNYLVELRKHEIAEAEQIVECGSRC
jgi:hypothetical protein